MSTDTLASATGAVPRPITIPNDRSREDKIFRGVARVAGLTVFVILFLIGFFLLLRGLPALRAMGLEVLHHLGVQHRSQAVPLRGAGPDVRHHRHLRHRRDRRRSRRHRHGALPDRIRPDPVPSGPHRSRRPRCRRSPASSSGSGRCKEFQPHITGTHTWIEPPPRLHPDLRGASRRRSTGRSSSPDWSSG